MSLILLESFDDGLFTERITAVSSFTVSSAQARTGANSLLCSTDSGHYSFGAADQHKTLIMGFGWWKSGGYNMDIHLQEGATQHVLIQGGSGGEVVIKRGDGTTLYTSPPNTLQLSTWAYIEVMVTLGDAPDGALKVAVNGTTLTDQTGIDTRNGGAGLVFDTVYIWGVNYYIDDLYFANGAGTRNNDLLGDTRIYTLFPNGNGFHSDLLGSDGDSIDNYLQVDEPTPSTADYNESATVGSIDTYSLDDLPVTTGIIRGIQHTLYAAKSDAGARSAREIIRSGSVDSSGADLTLGTGYVNFDAIHEVNPSDSSEFTITDINLLETGIEVRP